MNGKEHISPEELYRRIQECLKRPVQNRDIIRDNVDTLYDMLTTAREEARTDSLTQLPNYRALIEILEREDGKAKRYNEPLALAFIDFNELRDYNNVYGHIQANHAIKRVAEEIRKVLRKEDVAARYGGDEFCLVLPKADYKAIKKVIGRVVSTIHALSIDSVVGELPDDGYKKVTISVGYAVLKEDENIILALERANEAAHKAKEAHKKAAKKVSKVVKAE